MTFLLSVAILAAIYLVMGWVERRPRVRFRPLPSPRPYLATDLAWFGVAVAATAVSVFVLRPQLAKLEIAPIRDAIAGLPLLAKVFIGLVVFDGVSFGVHVALHRSDRLWNIHKVHHSSLHLDSLATTRTHMFENMLRFVPGQAVLFLIGMPAGAVTLTVTMAVVYGISNHSNLGVNLRWAEAVLVTPRLHRRHHVPETTQNNFGVMLTVWDRMLGTLVRRDTRPEERYGVPGEIDAYPQEFFAAFRQPALQLREQSRERQVAPTR